MIESALKVRAVWGYFVSGVGVGGKERVNRVLAAGVTLFERIETLRSKQRFHSCVERVVSALSF